jgi:hypothetical protein
MNSTYRMLGHSCRHTDCRKKKKRGAVVRRSKKVAAPLGAFAIPFVS